MKKKKRYVSIEESVLWDIYYDIIRKSKEVIECIQV